MTEKFNSQSCPICKSKTSFAFEGPHSIVRQCLNKNCEHYFATNIKQRDSIFDYSSPEHAIQKSADLKTKRHYKFINFLLKKNIITKNTRIIDLGAGLGNLAKCFKDKEFDVLCVEPDEQGRKALTLNGLQNVAFSSDIENGNFFDFVYLVEVVEHIPDPVDTLKSITQHLNKNAIIFLTTPSASGALGRFFKEKSNSFGIPSHIHYFTPKSLKKCLELSGFENVTRIYMPFLGGPPSRPLYFRIISRLLYMLNMSSAIVMLAEKRTTTSA